AAETGLAMITVDARGVPVTEASRFTSLCEFLRQDPEIRRRCYTCDAHGGLQSAIEGRPFVYQCHAGLVDFSVSIMWGEHYLGALLCGQVLLDRGQHELHRMANTSGELLNSPKARALLDEVTVVDIGRLQSAANEIVELANFGITSGSKVVDLAAPGPFLGRLPTMPSSKGKRPVAPLLAGRLKPLPLVPIETKNEQSVLAAAKFAANLQAGDLVANLEMIGTYLDDLFPRWSQKLPPTVLADFEDLLIGIASGEAVQFGRDITQAVMRHRAQRRRPLNRYECQVYAERLVIQLHNLCDENRLASERTISTLLNEIEKDPTSFLTVGKAAAYVMLSESHFARLFKAKTQVSFKTYVTAKRMERAKRELALTAKPILRIANELEFHPPNYFTRTFRKHFQMTPSEYREQHQGDTHG
ncbi:MAG: hypothetical protein CSA64_04080, partial [Arachnia propionica]